MVTPGKDSTASPRAFARAARPESRATHRHLRGSLSPLFFLLIGLGVVVPGAWGQDVPECPDPGMCFLDQDAKDAWAAERGCAFAGPEENGDCTVTAEMLGEVWPNADADLLQDFADQLDGNLVEYNLDTPERLSHFFAQVREETGPRLRLRESMNYTSAALKATFSYFARNPDEADRYGRLQDANGRVTQVADQEAIANRAYAGRIGNGDVASGDGWAFRGGGLLQTTGRDNYQSLQDAYENSSGDDGIDFVENPELLEQPQYALASAAHYWTENGLHLSADAGTGGGDVDAITRVINRHTSSYGDRRDHFDAIWSNNVFEDVDCGS
ncbi:glycoside hydrolase family 19 protein [Lysobacter sp. SG-8]|uniref:Glycoside hydrolase family 19 protein n=1 Tax=Marilutibacter penaei TaxID=2759900 RepID=A0A7W3U526_9GAMM|nr:glycoside hydrolase family 19 protein [Lysobacter penaei]MBB1088720.1 glycoside hydrolase family 19 protein [Lysobacter penaei]